MGLRYEESTPRLSQLRSVKGVTPKISAASLIVR